LFFYPSTGENRRKNYDGERVLPEDWEYSIEREKHPRRYISDFISYAQITLFTILLTIPTKVTSHAGKATYMKYLEIRYNCASPVASANTRVIVVYMPRGKTSPVPGIVAETVRLYRWRHVCCRPECFIRLLYFKILPYPVPVCNNLKKFVIKLYL
jgi:hypothetical protein